MDTAPAAGEFQQNDTFLTKQSWWLCYQEGQGLYCILCKKHGAKNLQNKESKFAETPGVRFHTDAIKGHATGKAHKDARSAEYMQRVSSIYQQHREGVLHKRSAYQKAFACAYFVMKETLPNVKFMPLIKFIEKTCEVTQLSHFNHTSPASHREMFLELGAAVKDRVLENVPKEGPIGLLTDEATDISVTSQLISFIQFFNKVLGKTDTAFLGIQDVLEEHDAPDAKTITEKLEHLLQENGLSVESVGAMATDGAKVMTGRNEGVVAKLRRKKTNKNLIGVHCICHNLQLAGNANVCTPTWQPCFRKLGVYVILLSCFPF